MPGQFAGRLVGERDAVHDRHLHVGDEEVEARRRSRVSRSSASTPWQAVSTVCPSSSSARLTKALTESSSSVSRIRMTIPHPAPLGVDSNTPT